MPMHRATSETKKRGEHETRQKTARSNCAGAWTNRGHDRDDQRRRRCPTGHDDRTMEGETDVGEFEGVGGTLSRSPKTGTKATVSSLPRAGAAEGGDPKATKKASVLNPAPKRPATTMSRMKPKTRESIVAAPTTPAARATCLFSPPGTVSFMSRSLAAPGDRGRLRRAPPAFREAPPHSARPRRQPCSGT